MTVHDLFPLRNKQNTSSDGRVDFQVTFHDEKLIVNNYTSVSTHALLQKQYVFFRYYLQVYVLLFEILLPCLFNADAVIFISMIHTFHCSHKNFLDVAFVLKYNQT